MCRLLWKRGCRVRKGAEAIADVLFGDVNPGGKLPITIPRDVGQIPIYYGHKPSGGHSHWKTTYVEQSNTPLYPFGYGLSYSCFQLGNLRVEKTRMQPGDSVEIQVDVCNDGPYAGDEVVQLYIRDVVASVTRPIKELKGFKRVTVAPGESRTVTFTLYANQLGFYDQRMVYVVEPGEIEIMVGTSSQDLPLKASIEVIGPVTDVSHDKSFFSQVITT